MTNQSPTLTDLQALETDLEISARIALRERLNRLIKDPQSTIDEIKELVALLSKMVTDYSRRVRAHTRGRELALAELRLEVRMEAMALQRAKMEFNPQSAPCRDESSKAPSAGNDAQPQTADSVKPHPELSAVSFPELAVLLKDAPFWNADSAAITEESTSQQGRNEIPYDPPLGNNAESSSISSVA